MFRSPHEICFVSESKRRSNEFINKILINLSFFVPGDLYLPVIWNWFHLIFDFAASMWISFVQILSTVSISIPFLPGLDKYSGKKHSDRKNRLAKFPLKQQDMVSAIMFQQKHQIRPKLLPKRNFWSKSKLTILRTDSTRFQAYSFVFFFGIKKTVWLQNLSVMCQ